jgi:flagellin-like hook-associated protein FlgL
LQGSLTLRSTVGSFTVTTGTAGTLFAASTTEAQTSGTVFSDLGDVDLSSTDLSRLSLSVIDGDLTAARTSLEKIGGLERRLEGAMRNSKSMSAEWGIGLSHMMDADFAQETAKLVAAKMQKEATTSSLAMSAKGMRDSMLRLLN